MPATVARSVPLLAALGAAGLLACVDPGVAFRCLSSDDCRDGLRAGTCEETRFCSFPDPACAGTARRYAAWAGEFARRCVPATGADAGADATTDTGVTTGDAAPDAPLCADEGLPCCDGTSGCSEYLDCIAGVCRGTCGQWHEPCCPANTCAVMLACVCSGGRCACNVE
ncbi:MAG TPA: hypothetical protein VGQ83_20870 [Polyangia bacterium]|jgi:hypothetical protein